jgi:hypothetical protein
MTYQLMGISEVEVEQLKQELGAVVDRIRGQAEDGKDCGTVEVTAGPTCEDLSVSAEADEKIAGAAKARLDLVFDHPEFGKIRVRISTRNGSIWFVKAVPEAVIDYVFEVFCRVKGI